MILTPEQIEKAVEWWAKDVQNPTLQKVQPDDEKEDQIVDRALHVMNIKTLADSKIEIFRNCLRQLLSKQKVPFEIRVDYHPEEHLMEAAYVADIPHSNFSIQTLMLFHHDGAVTVSHGYRAEFIKI